MTATALAAVPQIVENAGTQEDRMPGKTLQWVPDDLWERVQTLLPKPRRRRNRYLGRKPIEDRETR